MCHPPIFSKEINGEAAIEIEGEKSHWISYSNLPVTYFIGSLTG
jgi:hypothetical protein